MQCLKDFSRALKPVDISYDQNRPSDLEFVTYLGELFSRDEQTLHAKFKTKHLRRMGPKRTVMWQLNRLKEVKRAIREASTGTAPGLSGLMTETIKLSGDEFAQVILEVITAYWCKAHKGQGVPIPESLLAAKVFMIPIIVAKRLSEFDP